MASPPLKLGQNTLAEEQTKNSSFSKKIHENHLFQFRPSSAILIIETRRVPKPLGTFFVAELQSPTDSFTLQVVNLTSDEEEEEGRGRSSDRKRLQIHGFFTKKCI